jgi:hypothetical protein
VILADGNYRATLSRASVSNASNTPLPADYVFDFFVLAADANRDRKVDFNDLAILAQNYNTTGGMTFVKGDFNYDGNVNFNDLAILAQRYNTTLAPPPAALPAATAIAMVSPPRAPAPKRRAAEAIFNTTAPIHPPSSKATSPSFH